MFISAVRQIVCLCLVTMSTTIPLFLAFMWISTFS
jgi:hypothetical protein